MWIIGIIRCRFRLRSKCPTVCLYSLPGLTLQTVFRWRSTTCMYLTVTEAVCTTTNGTGKSKQESPRKRWNSRALDGKNDNTNTNSVSNYFTCVSLSVCVSVVVGVQTDVRDAVLHPFIRQQDVSSGYVSATCLPVSDIQRHWWQ